MADDVQNLIPPEAGTIVDEQDEKRVQELERKLITNTLSVQAQPDPVEEETESPLSAPKFEKPPDDWEGEGDIAWEVIVKALLAEVGTVESPPNSNRTKYGKAYGMDGVAWCAMFVSWGHNVTGSLHMCNFSTSKGYAYTPAGAEGFRRRGQWGTTPKEGAHVFYRFPGGPARIHHVGVVIGHSANWIEAVEGNTSPGTGGSQRDGGGVFRRRRSSGIVGYGYPAYGSRGAGTLPTPSPAPGGLATPPGQGGGKRPYPGYRGRYGGYNRMEFQGRTDGNVRWIQEVLNKTNLEPKLKASGVFGPKTEAAVKGFQGAMGYLTRDRDGIVGPRTWSDLNRFA